MITSQKYLKAQQFKYIIFISIILGLMLLNWYYVTAFCAIYPNAYAGFYNGVILTFVIDFFFLQFFIVIISAILRAIYYTNPNMKRLMQIVNFVMKKKF